jgi:hypothetical protein
MNHKPLGRHIVMDPRICHGQPTFRGRNGSTRFAFCYSELEVYCHWVNLR